MAFLGALGSTAAGTAGTAAAGTGAATAGGAGAATGAGAASGLAGAGSTGGGGLMSGLGSSGLGNLFQSKIMPMVQNIDQKSSDQQAALAQSYNGAIQGGGYRPSPLPQVAPQSNDLQQLQQLGSYAQSLFPQGQSQPQGPTTNPSNNYGLSLGKTNLQ